MSERLSRPTCLIVASAAAAAGVSADSFLHSFTLASAAFNLQVATPGGKPIDFVDVNEANMRWIQDFRMKSYANPAKLESTDGARYHALLIPDCPGAMTDLANSGYLARILQHFSSENKPICAVGHGVAALCCATKEDKSWVFEGYSLTGPSVFELIRLPHFASLPIIVEDFAKDSGANFSANPNDFLLLGVDSYANEFLLGVANSGASRNSVPVRSGLKIALLINMVFSVNIASKADAVHVVLDRHLVTGQNGNSTVAAVQNLIFLCSGRK